MLAITEHFIGRIRNLIADA